jgi:hypothetical protein
VLHIIAHNEELPAGWQIAVMRRQVTGGMHVDRVRSRHTSKSGKTHEYVSYLVRRSFRKSDGKVGRETLANLSMLPPAAVDAIAPIPLTLTLA